MTESRSSRSKAFGWARDMADSATPMFLLDRKRRLTLFNRGCCDRTGWTAEELLGQTCDYTTEADPHAAAAVLAVCAPPAEVWQGQVAEVPILLPHRTEPPQAARMRFEPLWDGDGYVRQVLGRLLGADDPASPSLPTPAQTLHAELAALRHELRRRYRQESIIGRSPPMRRVLAQLAAARAGTESVLFVGEPGTGREHLARVLHTGGRHAQRAFVPVDCRGTSGSELKRILKHLEEDRLDADGLRAGTLFLADIAAAPRDFQDRLAEWLNSRNVETSPRILAAAARLSELQREEFQRESYYLLTTTVIEIPALRHRGEDVLPLAQFFLEERNISAERQISGFSSEAAEELRRYRWPGNVAELREAVESAVTRTAGPLVVPADLPLSFRVGQDEQRLGPVQRPPILPLDTVLEQVEREQIQSALAACRDNLSKAAELLGMSRPKLYRRLEALGLATPASPESES